ncbi:MAG: epoxyqueuosine reductase QueH [Acetanaerobacterium sp.]
MNNRGYQRELDAIVAGIPSEGEAPSLLLHACCAPCASYVLEYLSQYFRITLYYYNPNISSPEEYAKRVGEVNRLVTLLPAARPVKLIEGEYDPERFLSLAKGLEGEREGGARCARCYELRLQSTAQLAREQGFDYFTTTLSISPYKNADKLNEIGERLAQQYGVKHLPCDFKKRGGFKRSVELSAQYGLYRQDYCGCVFSMESGGIARGDKIQKA